MERNALPVTVAVVGHIDHGKSTLIGRLLYDSKQVKSDKLEELKKFGNQYSILLDNFQDEREKEMTIDVSYASIKTSRGEVILIDNPGHREFIKNMLSGTSQATSAIVVISVDTTGGVQTQTRVHLMLLKLLGIKKLVVAVNKMDKALFRRARFEKIISEINKVMRGIEYKNASMVCLPVVARDGDNLFFRSKRMRWYRGKTLFQLLNGFLPQKIAPKASGLRLPVQEIDYDGRHRLAVGRIESGVIKKGQAVILAPSGVGLKVKTIRKATGFVKTAFPGETVGLIFKQGPPNNIKNQVIGPPGNFPRVVQKFRAQVFVFPGKTIKLNEKLTVRVGLTMAPCLVSKIAKSQKRRATCATLEEIELKLDQPIVAEKYSQYPSLGRFILLRAKEIIAAGVIV